VNQTAVKSIIFFADFTKDGNLSEKSRDEYESCLERASSWGATLRIIHARPVSDMTSPIYSDYDNSPDQRARRRAEYVLSGLILRAEERGLKAEAGVVHGAVGVDLVRESENREDTIVWSDFAVPFAESEGRD
jgi:hypothetical protein